MNINIRGTILNNNFGQLDDPYANPDVIAGKIVVSTKRPPKGGNYLLKDYSVMISQDVEALFRAAGMVIGDWFSVAVTDGRTFNLRWDMVNSDASVGGRMSIFTPIANADILKAKPTDATTLSGPPANFVQPQRYVDGVPSGF